jgi:hypothetical protein
MAIIIFEIFSGINPYPGHMGQIFEAKRLDKKPALPSDFPSELKELVIQGWSKNPKERPPIQKFKTALHKMLLKEGKKQSLTLKGESSSNKKEGHVLSHEECEDAGKTEAEFCTTTKAGDPA